jgi:hypothetical protein
MSSLSLAEELVLLSYDDSGAALIASPDLDYAVAGAVLCELTMAGQIDLDHAGLVVLTGSRPADDPLPAGGHHATPYLDRALASIAAGPPNPPERWVVKLSDDLVGQVLDALTDAGLLRRAPGRVLWILGRSRYLPPDGGGRAAEQAAEADARSRLAAARRGTRPVDARTNALAGLLHALETDQPAGPDPAAGPDPTDGEAVEQPAQWPLRATAKAIADHRTAVASGVFIATNVAAGGS